MNTRHILSSTKANLSLFGKETYRKMAIYSEEIPLSNI